MLLATCALRGWSDEMTNLMMATETGDDFTLVAPGELDISTSELLAASAAARGGRGRLCIDLRDITFIDARGLRCLLALRRASDVRFVNPSGAVSRLIDITDTRSQLLDDRAAAAV